MCSNVPILSQWGMNFSDGLGPYKSYKNTGFPFILSFPLSHTSILWKQKEWKRKKTIANVSYCLRGKAKQSKGMQNSLIHTVYW